jgi:hypothetical protein
LKLLLLSDPSQIRAAGWSAFINAHTDGTVFQSPEMYEFFLGVPGFDPVVLAVHDERKALAGILLGVVIREMKGLAGYFSSRTVVYGGPLIDPVHPDRDGVLSLLLQNLIRQVQHRSIFIQFRNFCDPASFISTFKTAGFHLRDRLNLIVDTSDRETAIRNMSASRWRQIRKGLGTRGLGDWEIGRLGDWEIGRLDDWAIGGSGNSNFDIRNQEPGTWNLEPGTWNQEPWNPGTDNKQARIITPGKISQVRRFYDILYRLYKYKVKKPLPPWEFFERFYLFSKKGKLGVILLVEYQGEIIGGILSPVTPGKTIYEWYVCGMDQEHKAVHPSVLATWAAIEYAVDHQIPQFDFMGVGIPEREYGVRDFKKRFGGEMVNYGRFARINNRFLYAIAETGYNILTLFRRI